MLQLARFGDLIQTSPLLRLLRARCPDARLRLVVDERAAPVARMLEGVDEVLPLALSWLPWRDGGTLADGLRDLRAWAAPLADLPASDVLLTLNQDILAGSIAELMPAKQRLGPRLRQPLPAPHRYLTFSLADRRFTPLHLSELWAAYAWQVPASPAASTMEGDGDGLSDSPLIPAPALRLSSLGPGFALLGVETGPGSLKPRRYAVNLGAGAAGRRLPAAALAALLTRLPESADVVLLGLPVDAPLARRLEEEALRTGGPRITNLVGRTSLLELPGVLAASDVLISGDTGTLQLAAATGTPSVGVFVNGANPVETGCYADGAVAVVQRTTLEGSEDDAPVDDLPVSRIHTIAATLAEGARWHERDTDATDDFTVLVARADAVGVRYPHPEPQRLECSAGERWTPVLRRFVHGTAVPLGGYERAAAPAENDPDRGRGWLAALSRAASQPTPEGRWLKGVVNAFTDQLNVIEAGAIAGSSGSEG